MRKRKRKATFPEKEEQLADQRMADQARALRDKIRKAEKAIRKYHQRWYPGKPLSHILLKINREISPFAELVAILMIKRNQGNRLSADETVSLERDRISLLESHPYLKKDFEQMECPAGF
jgi:hypothetical protein